MMASYFKMGKLSEGMTLRSLSFHHSQKLRLYRAVRLATYAAFYQALIEKQGARVKHWKGDFHILNNK